MAFKLNGKTGCTLKYDSLDICVAYYGGVKVFGCRSTASVSGNSGILSSKTFTFSEPSFTQDFTTDAPFTYNNVYLKSLTTVQLLKLVGNNAKVGDSFKAINSSGLKFQLGDQYAIYNGVLYEFTKNIDNIVQEYDALGYKLTANANGKLTFTNQSDETDVITIAGKVVNNSDLTFTFQVTDDSEQQLLTNTATFSLIPQGDVNIKSIYINTPPTIGSITIETKYTEPKILISSYFVEGTDPRFHDDQGDQPYQLKVLSLPLYGKLYLRGVEVVENQELFFTTDIVTEEFIYIPDNTRTDIDSTSFTFTVSDTGSKTYA